MQRKIEQNNRLYTFEIKSKIFNDEIFSQSNYRRAFIAGILPADRIGAAVSEHKLISLV